MVGIKQEMKTIREALQGVGAMLNGVKENAIIFRFAVCAFLIKYALYCIWLFIVFIKG